MKNDKRNLILLVGLAITVVLTIGLYAFMVVQNNSFNFGELFPISITLLVIIFLVIFIYRRSKDIKEGQPLEDERSKKVITLAAAKSFYISMYWLLALSMFEPFFAKLFDVEYLTASQVTGGGIAGMAISMLICWIYYNRKAELI